MGISDGHNDNLKPHSFGNWVFYAWIAVVIIGIAVALWVSYTSEGYYPAGNNNPEYYE